jgi:hypothetical protein
MHILPKHITYISNACLIVMNLVHALIPQWQTLNAVNIIIKICVICRDIAKPYDLRKRRANEAPNIFFTDQQFN